jgi:hypothetical protein
VCLVAFRFEVPQLHLRAVVLFDLLLGAVLGVPGQGTLGLLPHSLFLAVLGRYGHRVLLGVRDRRALCLRAQSDTGAAQLPGGWIRCGEHVRDTAITVVDFFEVRGRGASRALEKVLGTVGKPDLATSLLRH